RISQASSSSQHLQSSQPFNSIQSILSSLIHYLLSTCLLSPLHSITPIHIPTQTYTMANQCSGHSFAITQASNGNILTWHCHDCTGGPFTAVWICKICGYVRCHSCHQSKS